MPATRPGSVTVVAVLAYLNGVVNIVGGAITLFASDATMRQLDSAAMAGAVTAAIVSLLLGIVIVVVARGLLNGSRFARGLVTIVMVLNAINGGFLLFSLHFLSGIPQIFWAVIMLALLHTRRATVFFAERLTGDGGDRRADRGE